jgi:hypothetical protein
MSSSEAAAKTVPTRTVRPKRPVKPASAGLPAAAAPVAEAAATDIAETAMHLAEDLQRSLAAGQFDVLPPAVVQMLMTATCRLYAAQIEAGQQYLPVANVTSTDLMVTASGILKAGNLAVFELGMWQSWTGR